MPRKLHPTFADYIVIALSPALIMLLVGSLVFFLIEVFYQGNYDTRLSFIMAMFVMAAVLIARISIEESREYAMLFAIPLAIVTAIACVRFVEFRGPLQSFSTVINLGLIALIWWCADRLTWDSTVIDESKDASGEGLLQTAGLDDQATTQSASSEAAATQPVQTLWQRFVAYRRKRHSPGVWVIYFSLAALPIFGFGNWFISGDDLQGKRYVFKLLVVYVGSALGLLLTTSFLNLRRYLRQRRLEMPMEMAGTWIGTGAAMIVALLLVCTLLPRRNPEYSITQLPMFAGSPSDLWTTEYAVGNEGQEDPEKADRAGEQQSESGSQGDSSQSPNQNQKQDQKSSGDQSQNGQSPGQQNNSSDKQQGSQSQSQSDSQSKSGSQSGSQSDSQGGSKDSKNQSGQKSSGNQSQSDSQNGKGAGQDKSGSQSNSSGKDGKQGPSMDDKQGQGKSDSEKSGEGKQSKQGQNQKKNQNQKPDSQQTNDQNRQQQGNNSEQQSNEGSQQSDQKKREAEQKEKQQREKQGNKSEKSEPQKAAPPPPPKTTTKFNPSKIFSALGGTIGQLLKLLYWVAAIAIVGYFVWKYWRQIKEALANFMKSLRDFWESLFGRKPVVQAEELAAAEAAPPPISFSAFQDPFLTGMAQNKSPVEVIQYSFAALEAWARELGCARQPEQTPQEFVQSVGSHQTMVARDVATLGEMYNRCAYSRESGQRLNIEPLRKLWQQMRERMGA